MRRGLFNLIRLFFLFIIFFFSFKFKVEAICNNVKVTSWNDDFSFSNENISYVNDVNELGSLCTIVEDGQIGPLSIGMAKCENGKYNYFLNSELSGEPGAFDENYYCVQKIETKNGVKTFTADMKKGVPCQYSYPTQGPEWEASVEVMYSTLQQISQFIEPNRVCKDENTIGRCVMDGTVQAIRKENPCGFNYMCKNFKEFGAFDARCVKAECKENGVTTTHGNKVCIPEKVNDPYTNWSVKECFIDQYVEIEKCQKDCGTNTMGQASCNSIDDTITCDDKKITPEVVLPRNMVCSDQTPYYCNDNGVFDPLDTCVKPKECVKYTDKDGKIMAGCQDPSNPDSGVTILNITTYSTQEFFCGDGDNSIKTALGCIPFTVSKLVEKLLPMIFGITGGIAFLMMVYGFIMISTSSGDEKKVQAAKQIVTSAIIGLLVSVFALFLYKLIAVDILQIPGI